LRLRAQPAPPNQRADYDERQPDNVLDAAQIEIPAVMAAVAQIRDRHSHRAQTRECRQGDAEHHDQQPASALPTGCERRLRIR
jgi:hypothetical protein